ncbi:unnamed protein product [Allacma fusca]|uniref:Ig-like domain-containing protein n=1 Tax=Allacma fusca TaxID=39272 RepID=A0A8J2PAX9_9HEXA|nr:unnamed protein product [Allacma fusca]
MDLIPLVFLLTFTVPTSRSAPQPQLDTGDFFDTDDAEIAVPRSPQILGPQTEYLIFPSGYKIQNLTCQVTGIPMPKVIWIKDSVVSIFE